MAKKITTIYISDTSVRLMVANGKRISKLADAPLDMDLSDTSIKVREAEVVAKIKHLFKAHKIEAKKVILGMSGLYCLSRPAVLPQLPKAMLDEAVIREAKRVMPIPPEQLYISWQLTSAVEGKMQAFMVAMPRQIVDTLLSILHQVGLKPYLMDIKPLALARLVKEASAIVVDIQSREFDIVIITDGVPQPIRTVPFPQEALSISEKLLIVKDELKRTIQFYNSNNPQKPLQPDVTMYVSGELADEPQLYESLANELGYRVLPLSSPLKYPKQLDPAHYLVNIGLALKELRKEAGPSLANLNILPDAYQPKPVSLVKLVALPASTFAIGLIVLLAMTIQDVAAGIDSAQNQLDSTNFVLAQRQAQKKDLTAQITAMEKKLADTEANRNIFTAALDSIGKQGDVIDGDLKATVNNLMSSIDLTNIAHSSQGLMINGQSPSEVEVLSYSRRLDASGRFSEVTIASLLRLETSDNGSGDNVTGGMDFTLALKLKGAE